MNNKGYTVTFALILAAAFALAAVTLPQYLVKLIGREQKSALQFSALSLSNSVQALLDGDAAWYQTLMNNASLSCLRPSAAGTVCDSNNFGLINVYGADGKKLFNSGLPASTDGFDETGAACSTFSPAGDATCVFHFDVSWSIPGCPAKSGPCAAKFTTAFGAGPLVASTPQIQLVGQLFYSPLKGRQYLNPGKYSFVLNRGSQANTLSAACNRFNNLFKSTFNQQTQKCNLAGLPTFPPFDCKAQLGTANAFLVGFDNLGNPKCATQYSSNGATGTSCPVKPSGAAQGAIGIDPRGFLLCGPY